MMIRVQANGGKFLADDIGGAEVTVRDARTGRWLNGGRVQGPRSKSKLRASTRRPLPQCRRAPATSAPGR
jgi:hypothetical protein